MYEISQSWLALKSSHYTNIKLLEPIKIFLTPVLNWSGSSPQSSLKSQKVNKVTNLRSFTNVFKLAYLLMNWLGLAPVERIDAGSRKQKTEYSEKGLNPKFQVDPLKETKKYFIS